MNICIAGKNNIAIDVCKFVVAHYPKANILALINGNETGVEGWQGSYLKYVESESRVRLAQLEEIFAIEDLIFISTEYDRIIKPDLFKTKQLYNIHFSLLPAYKGVYTSAWPILNGEQYSGVTLHKIEQGIDTGDIIAQKKFMLSPKETSFSLYQKYIERGTQLVIENIDKLIQNKIKFYPQSSKESSYYSKKSIDYAHLTINLNATAAQLDQQIRAFYFPAFQLPKVHGYEIVDTYITDEKSMWKAGTILQEGNDYIKVSTIDYNIVLYKNKHEKTK